MFKDFLNLIFPQVCVVCGGNLLSQEELCCTYCQMQLPKTNFHLLDDNPLMNRFYGKVPISDVFSYLKFVKGGMAQTLMHQFKYEQRLQVGEVLARWFVYDLMKEGKLRNIDLIVPVPLHKRKLKQRGYNQSHIFGQAMAKEAKIAYCDQLLVRTVNTSAQALQKDKLSRWKNVDGNFAVNAAEEIAHQHILVVDDVLTTGATLEASCLPLLEGGAKAISFATLAVAI